MDISITDLRRDAETVAFYAGRWRAWQAAYQKLRFDFAVREAAIRALREVGREAEAMQFEEAIRVHSSDGS